MRHLLAASLLALGACSGPNDTNATASTDAVPAAREASAPDPMTTVRVIGENPPLSGRLDCLRKTGGVLLIGHRGGPTRDYPENAIETFQRTYDAGTHAMETDISETKDGVLILMHDDDLARTTTGVGLVSDHTLAEVQAAKLKTSSKTTSFAPPTLEAALAWAMKNNAVLELDKKKSAEWAPIIAAVRTAKAENNVFLVTYTDDQAAEVHTLAPDLMITATVTDPAHLEALVASGVRTDHLIAWTGVTKPDPALWNALAEHGIESAFGTLGPRATSLDTRYWDDGDGSEYNELVSGGLAILVTDITDKTARQLAGLRQKSAACGL
ncbi:MAG: glycerophosphodiester phosphodiesterase family protein [Hyphomonadaceae bacterium]